MEKQQFDGEFGNKLVESVQSYYERFSTTETPLPSYNTLSSGINLPSPYGNSYGDVDFYTETPSVNPQYVNYPRCWDSKFKGEKTFGAFVNQAISDYSNGNVRVALEELDLMKTGLLKRLNVDESIFNQVDYKRALGRINMEQAVACRVASGFLNNRYFLDQSKAYFGEAFKIGLELKDMSLLLELERHTVNYFLARGKIPSAITSAIKSFALAEKLIPQRSDPDWFSKGLVKSLTDERNNGNALPLISFFFENGFFRKGVMLGIKKSLNR